MRQSTLHFAFAYVKHWLLKEDRYSQQSPFIFSVYQGVMDCLKKENPFTKKEKIELLYSYFCQLTNAKQVLVLGTGSGTSTRLLNQVTKGKVHCISQQELIAQEIEVFRQSILKLQALDFVLIHPNFSQAILSKQITVCLTRMDAQGLLLVEGIHLNKEMNTCWKEIQLNNRIQLTFDFFDFGVAFLSFSGPKTTLKLSY